MKKTFLLIVAASLTFAACNQHEGAKIRIKKTSSGRGEITEYTYTPDGKIASKFTSDGVKTTYTYTGKTIDQKIVDSIHGKSINATVFLNSKGIVDSSVASDEHNSYKNTYTHDADGYIVESKNFVSGNLTSMSSSVMKDGNVVETTMKNGDEQPAFKIIFDYYKDKPNTLSLENYGMPYVGNDSKNLPKNLMQISPKGDTLRASIYYHYDKEGRVIQKAVYDEHGMQVDSSTFSY